MLLNHVIGMYTHPKEECRNIDRRQETFFYAFSHFAIIALIPTIVAYYSTVYTGWSMGGDLIKLSESSALLMATGMYFGLVGINHHFHAITRVSRLHRYPIIYGGFCWFVSRALGGNGCTISRCKLFSLPTFFWCAFAITIATRKRVYLFQLSGYLWASINGYFNDWRSTIVGYYNRPYFRQLANKTIVNYFTHSAIK